MNTQNFRYDNVEFTNVEFTMETQPSKFWEPSRCKISCGEDITVENVRLHNRVTGIALEILHYFLGPLFSVFGRTFDAKITKVKTNAGNEVYLNKASLGKRVEEFKAGKNEKIQKINKTGLTALRLIKKEIEAEAQATREAAEQTKREAAEQATREATIEAAEQATIEATIEAAETAKREAAEQATIEAAETAKREAAEQATIEAAEKKKNHLVKIKAGSDRAYHIKNVLPSLNTSEVLSEILGYKLFLGGGFQYATYVKDFPIDWIVKNIEVFSKTDEFRSMSIFNALSEMGEVDLLKMIKGFPARWISTNLTKLTNISPNLFTHLTSEQVKGLYPISPEAVTKLAELVDGGYLKEDNLSNEMKLIIENKKHCQTTLLFYVRSLGHNYEIPDNFYELFVEASAPPKVDVRDKDLDKGFVLDRNLRDKYKSNIKAIEAVLELIENKTKVNPETHLKTNSFKELLENTDTIPKFRKEASRLLHPDKGGKNDEMQVLNEGTAALESFGICKLNKKENENSRRQPSHRIPPSSFGGPSTGSLPLLLEDRVG